MYNVDDLILNIDNDYKDCEDRLRKNYRAEFENYSPSKLEKVWECIQENHSYAKAPELGNIFKYMNLVGIPRSKQDGRFYNRCTNLVNDLDYVGKPIILDGENVKVECGTKYSIGSKFCPKCNHNKSLENINFNERVVVKCNVLPKDLLVLNELCSNCSKYHRDMFVRGSKCSAWNSHDEYKKSGKVCKDCPCFNCCNERPTNGHEKAKTDFIKKMKIKKV